MSRSAAQLRDIPPVDALLARAMHRPELKDLPRSRVLAAVRAELAALRGEVERGERVALRDWFDAAGGGFLDAVAARVARDQRPRHEAVINATGILLHTGLGRAPLAEVAARAAAAAARYAVVEVSPETAERDLREQRVAELLCAITGAEAATVVNNNAGAVLLALKSLAAGREVVCSRGELVEIGGGFRMPDVMAASGCILKEVGTSNRTHLRDYEAAVGGATGLLLKVHPSNFRVLGFTAEASLGELADLGRRRGIPLVFDVGSGLLRPSEALPLRGEPDVTAAVAAGCDAVTFSGDKLLCGPQAGIVVGRRAIVDRLRADPLFRALRPGKLELAALEATLLVHRAAEDGDPALPLFERIALKPAELARRARELEAALGGIAGVRARVVETEGFLGSGSAPAVGFAGAALAVEKDGVRADDLAARLRSGSPRVFARIHEGRVHLELRTVFDDQLPALRQALLEALA